MTAAACTTRLTRIKFLFCILAVSGLVWPACSNDRLTMARNDRGDTETATQQREIYREKAEAKLRELDRQIDALETQTQKKTEAERQQYAPQLAELNRKRQIAHEKLDKLKTSSQEAWEDMKVGINAALDNLDTASKQAVSHFKR